jgi:hypothetical protein
MLFRRLGNLAVGAIALAALQLVSADAAIGPALRTAIVVGNSTYPKDQLKNPTNDARAMASVLREVGFDVLLVEDVRLDQFRTLIKDLPTRFAQGGVGLFYYAGHAVQYRGFNYLLPVDFDLKQPEDLPTVSVNLTSVIDEMNNAGVDFNIVILDSCRNYPFGELADAFGSGLATVAVTGETLIAYATAAGDVALDGNGPNSPYTSALVSALELRGRDIYEIFRIVRAKVREATNGRQLPWIYGSVESELVFRPPDLTAEKDGGGFDLASVLWRSIEKSRDPADFSKFLALYPDDPRADDAIARRGLLVAKGVTDLPSISVEVEKIIGPGGAPIEVTSCDLWASDPFDPQRIAPGVPWELVNTRQAIRDCVADLAKDPENPRLLFNLARALDLAERFREAEIYYQRAADQGYGEAFMRLGLMYRNARGVARDDQRAAKYYLEGSLRGVPAARAALAMMYEKGWGIPQSSRESIRWLSLAAEDNFGPAVDHLGNVYRLGKGVAVDLARARELYERAAFGGNTNAMANLGRLYREGLGVPADLAQAVRWYGRATELGNPFAPYKLSEMYLEGVEPLRRDPARALHLLELSADRGYEWAFWRLARFYENAEAGTKDLETAAYYVHIARAAAESVHNPSGDQLAADAARRLEELSRIVDPAVLQRAEARAQAWLKQNGVAQIGLFYQY